jgi:hypothetical protein
MSVAFCAIAVVEFNTIAAAARKEVAFMLIDLKFS